MLVQASNSLMIVDFAEQSRRPGGRHGLPLHWRECHRAENGIRSTAIGEFGLQASLQDETPANPCLRPTPVRAYRLIVWNTADFASATRGGLQ